MGRKSLKDSRQEEIINAFYEVAKEIGLENTSIAKVAEHMGINPSLVLHYFKTRDELLNGLIEFILKKYNGIYKSTEQGLTTLHDLYKLIDSLFSRKWNHLFDDGVFYSCYALVYRDKTVKKSFRLLHEALRHALAEALRTANENGVIEIENEEETTELIFALVEGAYYYLGMVDNKRVYKQKLSFFRNQALTILNVPVHEEA